MERISSANDLIGLRIIDIRKLTDAELQELGWYNNAIVLVLSDGTILYPSKDDEGNDSGALFGNLKNGTFFGF